MFKRIVLSHVYTLNKNKFRVIDLFSNLWLRNELSPTEFEHRSWRRVEYDFIREIRFWNYNFTLFWKLIYTLKHLLKSTGMRISCNSKRCSIFAQIFNCREILFLSKTLLKFYNKPTTFIVSMASFPHTKVINLKCNCAWKRYEKLIFTTSFLHSYLIWQPINEVWNGSFPPPLNTPLAVRLR